MYTYYIKTQVKLFLAAHRRLNHACKCCRQKTKG